MVGFLLPSLAMFLNLPAAQISAATAVPPAAPASLSLPAAESPTADASLMTLDRAIQLARSANAKLPAAATETEIARQKLREARAERWLKVAVEGDFIYAPAGAYDPILTNLGEERLQVTGKQPIYDGGENRAAVSRAQAQTLAAEARYRIAERDLDLEVRSRYAELVSADGEIAARQAGIRRLEAYRDLLRSRRAAGQGVAADVLKTEVRLSSERAAVVEAQQRRDDSRLELNSLLGRDPSGPLRAAPLPAPGPPAVLSVEGEVPEVDAASAEVSSALADLLAARAQRRPHLFAAADAGLWGSDTTRIFPPDLRAGNWNPTFSDRLRRDSGYSVSLNLSWPIFDFGAASARTAQARLSVTKAELQRVVQQREAVLQREKARATVENLYREIEVLSAAAPSARDSYLEVESRFRGGAATSLEVLDAYAAAVEAEVRLAEVVSRYRIAEALRIRWSPW
ncbi:MAG: TolC family protein [Thermoanaerobaculia bacterium]